MRANLPDRWHRDAEIWKFLRDEWPLTADVHSSDYVSIPLTPDDISAIGSGVGWFRAQYGLDRPTPPSSGLRDSIEEALAAYPEGLFAKVGLFSFKSSDRPAHKTALQSFDDFLGLLRPAPDRLVRGLSHLIATGRTPQLYLMPWLDLPLWTEFRMFFRAGRCVGVSQYHTQDRFAQIGAQIGTIQTALAQAAEALAACCPTPDCVADVVVSRGPGGVNGFQLLEFNPLWASTDLCLFSGGAEKEFDGTLRYHPVTE